MRFILACTAALCAAAQDTSPHVPLPRQLCENCAARVSLMQLIATPERYHGKLVSVEGYLSVEFEDFGLYLTRDDFEHLNGSNAVWIDFKPGVLKGPAGMTPNDNKDLSGRFVRLEGTFDAQYHGHMGAFAGSMHNISRIDVVRKYRSAKNK